MQFHPHPHKADLLFLQDTNVYVDGAVIHLGYREKRCEKGDEIICLSL